MLTSDEVRSITESLVGFNNSHAPFTQQPAFINLNYGIKNRAGQVIAGVVALLYCWRVLSIEVLWTDQQARCHGFGSALLEAVERETRRYGAELAHLDTFEFQTKKFYERRGYEVFGILENCAPGTKRFYMKKLL